MKRRVWGYNKCFSFSIVCFQLILFTLFAFEAEAVVRYVKPVSAGLGNGSSWADASNDLQLMINNSASGDTIWVAAGTYIPVRPANNLGTISSPNSSNAFVLKLNVQLFGGFAGNETYFYQRNWNSNTTVLSGNNYCYHVVISSGNVGNACLDGFTITNGNASSLGGNIVVNSNTVYNYFGGGMYNISSSPTLSNIVFSGNKSSDRGGGMYNESSSPVLTDVFISGSSAIRGGGIFNDYGASPVLTYVTISGNMASEVGGGINNWHGSSPTLSYVTVKGNSAGTGGGGIFNQENSSPTLTNVLICGNSSGSVGGGIDNFHSSPTLTNVTISGNRAGTYGGGIYNQDSSFATVYNSIVWGNTAATNNNNVHNVSGNATTFYYSLVQTNGNGIGSGWDNSLGINGGNNLPTNSNPLFVSPMAAFAAPIVSGDYHLQISSPAIDKGNASYLVNISTDMDGYPRISGCGLDLGPYEIQSSYIFPTLNHTSDTTICYGDTARFVLTITGIPPWKIIYTEDYSVSFDTLESTTDSLFYWNVSPQNYTLYKFVKIQDGNCALDINSNLQVDVLPAPTVSTILKNDTVCHGEKIENILFTGSANMFTWWSSGDVINNIPTDTATTPFYGYTVYNTSDSVLMTKITITPTYIDYHANYTAVCNGKDTSFFITVLPIPTIDNSLADDTLCGREKTHPVVFSGVATNFEWNASGDTIKGIPTGIQTGIFDEYFVENKENTSLTSLITVKPIYTLNKKTCVGTNASFFITVFSEPILANTLQNDTLCSGEHTNTVQFSGTATSFEWVASGDSINGIPLGIQIGDFGEYFIENKGDTLLTSVITVTPKRTGNGKICAGADSTFSITVYPHPTITTVLQDDSLCDGETTNPVFFDGNANLYEWTATSNISGIPTNGTGNFGEYTVNNKTSSPIKSVITVTPKYAAGKKECKGIDQTFDIIVNPVTAIESIAANSKSVCEGDELRIEANATGGNLVYQWYRDDSLLQGEHKREYIVPAVTQDNSGTYYAAVSGACGSAKSQKITVNTGAVNVLVEKWDDVILVNNASLEYIGYQWYKDGKMLNGATEQFYQEIGGLNGCYSVDLRLKKGGRIRSCERCAYKTSKSALSVYPNPTTGKFTILDLRFTIENTARHSERSEKSITIYDVVGCAVGSYCIPPTEDEIEIDISHLSAGIYFLKIQTNKESVMKKVIKE